MIHVGAEGGRLLKEEQDPDASGALGSTKKLPNEARMVKKFRRAAAGLDEQLPSDLRPPPVLKVCFRVCIAHAFLLILAGHA
jgi:hypothetical protein